MLPDCGPPGQTDHGGIRGSRSIEKPVAPPAPDLRCFRKKFVLKY